MLLPLGLAHIERRLLFLSLSSFPRLMSAAAAAAAADNNDRSVQVP